MIRLTPHCLFLNDHIQDLFKPYNLTQQHLTSAVTTAATTTAKGVDLTSFGDLNKASDEVIEKAKAIMSVDFEAKRLKPGDEGNSTPPIYRQLILDHTSNTPSGSDL